MIGAGLLAKGTRSVARTPNLVRASAVAERYRPYTMIPRHSLRRQPDDCAAMGTAGRRSGGVRRLARRDDPRPGRYAGPRSQVPPVRQFRGPPASPEDRRSSSDCLAARYSFAVRSTTTAARTNRTPGRCLRAVASMWSSTAAGSRTRSPSTNPRRPISVLRLDGDWYESTMTCLRGLVPHLAPKALVLVDDYYDWDGCARALHDYLAETKQPDAHPAKRVVRHLLPDQHAGKHDSALVGQNRRLRRKPCMLTPCATQTPDPDRCHFPVWWVPRLKCD